METNGADRGHSNTPEDLKSYMLAVDTLKTRPSVSIFRIPCLPSEEGAANTREDPPHDSKADISKETVEGSGDCKEIVNPQEPPTAGSKASPRHIQEHTASDSDSQRAREGDRNRSPNTDKGKKDKREPSTVCFSPQPVLTPSENRREPKDLFSGRRGRGRRSGIVRTPLENRVDAKGHNSAPSACAGTSLSRTQTQREASNRSPKSLPLPEGPGGGTSSQCEANVPLLLKKLQCHNTVKQVRSYRSSGRTVQQGSDHFVAQSQNANLLYNLRQPPKQQHPKRQFRVKPFHKRRSLHITLPQCTQEGQKIYFVLSEVAKAFNCQINTCEALQDVSEPRGMVYLPVGQCAYRPFVPAPDASPWLHPHAHGSQTALTRANQVTRDCERATCESQRKSNRIQDQLMYEEPFSKAPGDNELLQTLYPEVILSTTHPGAIEGSG
ncbi:uncharacterized protein LOC122266284 [Penaeus japonicus]|uniref:uncharacterized protein LOC122266284 n=1 Tax=Penaeus japonicus TaxID=27405 RepID=UPI001C70F8DA|nr:uncharacterized protein LOC122266284 [Penaeus japonicus]